MNSLQENSFVNNVNEREDSSQSANAQLWDFQMENYTWSGGKNGSVESKAFFFSCLRQCRVCGYSLSDSVLYVLLSHSPLLWLKSCATYCRLTLVEDSDPILWPRQAFSRAKLQLLLTQLVTQPKREPNVGTESEIGAETEEGPVDIMS